MACSRRGIPVSQSRQHGGHGQLRHLLGRGDADTRCDAHNVECLVYIAFQLISLYVPGSSRHVHRYRNNKVINLKVLMRPHPNAIKPTPNQPNRAQHSPTPRSTAQRYTNQPCKTESERTQPNRIRTNLIQSPTEHNSTQSRKLVLDRRDTESLRPPMRKRNQKHLKDTRRESFPRRGGSVAYPFPQRPLANELPKGNARGTARRRRPEPSHTSS